MADSAVAAAVSAAAELRVTGKAAIDNGSDNIMNDLLKRFLAEQDKQLIEARIREAEKRTSGEIVVKIAPASSRYPGAALLGSSMLSLAFSLLGMLVAGNRDMWMFLAVFAVLFMVLHELFRRCAVCRRPFVSVSDMQMEVEDAASGAFVRLGVHDTAGRTGILIYISVFERRVRVIADRGINEKVEPHLWQEVVDTIIAGIRSNRQGMAIAAAIDRCGGILALHFPRQPDDRNELSDSVVMGRSRP
jgi:putative membrane protein